MERQRDRSKRNQILSDIFTTTLREASGAEGTIRDGGWRGGGVGVRGRRREV